MSKKATPVLYRDFDNLKDSLSMMLIDQHFLAGTMTNIWSSGNKKKLKEITAVTNDFLSRAQNSVLSQSDIKSDLTDIENYLNKVIHKNTWSNWIADDVKSFLQNIQFLMDSISHEVSANHQTQLIELLQEILKFFDSKLVRACTENLSPIKDPTFAILTRIMQSNPNYSFIPKEPSMDAMFSMIDRAWYGKDWNRFRPEFSSNQMAILFGCSATTGFKWEQRKTASKLILRLMNIVYTAIERDGEKALNRYIDIVQEEALSRGISEKELWSEGWKSLLRKNGERQLDGAPPRILARDLTNLRDRMGLSLIDIQWLIGGINHRSSIKNTDVIEDPSFSILVRYLISYPDDVILPRAPNIEDFFEMINQYWSASKLNEYDFNKSRVGVMLGCTKIAAYSWEKRSTTPSQIVQHLMMVYANAIKLDGLKGLNNCLTQVINEQLSLDINSDDLWQDKGWGTFRRQGF